MTSPILLDTCALLWIAQDEPIGAEAVAALDALWLEGLAPLVSPISAWEVGMLSARGRIVLTMSPGRWWREAIERLGLELAPMSPELLIASTQLPGVAPNDPADRIVAATAREQNLRLMTRDSKLLAYGEAGRLQTIIC